MGIAKPAEPTKLMQRIHGHHHAANGCDWLNHSRSANQRLLICWGMRVQLTQFWCRLSHGSSMMELRPSIQHSVMHQCEAACLYTLYGVSHTVWQHYSSNEAPYSSGETASEFDIRTIRTIRKASKTYRKLLLIYILVFGLLFERVWAQPDTLMNGDNNTANNTPCYRRSLYTIPILKLLQ